MNKNYRLYRDSQLSEDQVEADVASYLGYITPLWSSMFQLNSVDEQLTGSDKLYNRFVPIYLQFKVSEGLKPLGINFTLSSPNRPLQRIRNFRRRNKINTDPTLYFRLRNMAKTATDFQHNILKSFHNPPHQYALYVAPLTLSMDEYNESLKASLIDRLFTFNPFFHRDERIFTNTGKQHLGLVPFLRGHISIPPHVDVTTSEHYYSYSKSGGNIAWHSGEKLKGDFRLSTQFKQILQQTYNYKESGYNKEEYVKFINEYSNSNDSDLKMDQNSLEYTILNFSQHLKQVYNIKLMFLEIKNSR